MDMDRKIWGGWYELYSEYTEKLKALGMEISYAKQKYGELVIEVEGPYSAEAQALIDECRRRSSHVCEECGGAGEPQDVHGWTSTLCHECAERQRIKLPIQEYFGDDSDESEEPDECCNAYAGGNADDDEQGCDDQYDELERLLENEFKTSFRFEDSLWRASLANADAIYVEDHDTSVYEALDRSFEEEGESANGQTMIFFELMKLRNRLLSNGCIEPAREIHGEMIKYMLMVDCVARKEFHHGTHVTIVEYPTPKRFSGGQ